MLWKITLESSECVDYNWSVEIVSIDRLRYQLVASSGLSTKYPHKWGQLDYLYNIDVNLFCDGPLASLHMHVVYRLAYLVVDWLHSCTCHRVAPFSFTAHK